MNKIPQKKLLYPPKIQDLFPEKAGQDKVDKMKLYTSTTKAEGGSTFVTHAIKTQSMTEIKRTYVKIKQMHPQAAHILAAFSFKNTEGYQDDREYGASSRMLAAIKDLNATNCCVFVVREYDGIHIGPRRHTLINTVVNEALTKVLQK